jgi:hypothetical protein
VTVPPPDRNRGRGIYLSLRRSSDSGRGSLVYPCRR